MLQMSHNTLTFREKLWIKVKDQIHSQSYLRETSYSDKEKSKTRFLFTLVLLIGAVAAFIVLFIYKASNRALIIKTEDNPSM